MGRLNDLQINIDQGGKVLLTPGELFSAGRRLRFRLKTRDHISHSENLEYTSNISRGRSKLWLPREGWTVACWWRDLQQCLWMVGTGTPEQFSNSFPHRFYRLFPKPEFSIQLLKELLQLEAESTLLSPCPQHVNIRAEVRGFAAATWSHESTGVNTLIFLPSLIDMASLTETIISAHS